MIIKVIQVGNLKRTNLFLTFRCVYLHYNNMKSFLQSGRSRTFGLSWLLRRQTQFNSCVKRDTLNISKRKIYDTGHFHNHRRTCDALVAFHSSGVAHMRRILKSARIIYLSFSIIICAYEYMSYYVTCRKLKTWPVNNDFFLKRR